MDKQIYQDDITKYRKKKESSTSDASKKSKHKHKYRKVLLRNTVDVLGKTGIHHSLGRICEACGRHKIDKYFITEKQADGTFLLLDEQRVLEIYSNLDIVDIGRNI